MEDRQESVARDTAQMPDLTNPKLIKLKGVLFLLMGILSSVLLLIRPRTTDDADDHDLIIRVGDVARASTPS